MDLIQHQLAILHFYTNEEAYIECKTGKSWYLQDGEFRSGFMYKLKDLWALERREFLSRQDGKLYITTLGVGAYNKSDRKYVSSHPSLTFSEMTLHRQINTRVEAEKKSARISEQEEIIESCVSVALKIEHLMDVPDSRIGVYYDFIEDYGELIIKALYALEQKGRIIVETQKH